jgi:hypothetical protein
VCLEHVKHCCLQVSPFSFTSKNLERKGYFKKMLEEIGGASVWPLESSGDGLRVAMREREKVTSKIDFTRELV